MAQKSTINTKPIKDYAKSLDTLTKSAKNATDAMKNLEDVYDDAPNTMGNAAKETKKAADETKKLGDNLQDVGNQSAGFFKQMKNALKDSEIFGWVSGLKNIKNTMEKLATPQAEYIENLNFLEQAYNNSAESGLKLLDTLEQTVGFDPAGLTKQLSMFRQFGNALNLDNDVASMLAENLLKLSIDTKSITGQSLDTVTNKFASAIAGNTRAVRAYGIDITMTGLQQEALNLGISKSVSEMTRAEKTILMYITMARQMSDANGDMARTVNSVANQYEIFKSQISETGRLIGGFLIPILKAVLPYINGVMMAINTLLSSLLSLFGIDAGSMSAEFGSFSSGLEDISDGFDDIGVSAGKAGKAAKEAQKSLRGFDKLNVIKTPTSTGGTGGTGGGVSGGIGGLGAIDKSLLEKLGEYDLHLDSISNKAADIRDSIMEWLGFTKYIDPITGDISWEYQGIQKTTENILGFIFDFKNPLAWIVDYFLAKGLISIFKIGKSLLDAVLTPFLPLLNKIVTVGKKGLTSLLKPFGDLGEVIKGRQKDFGSFWKGLEQGALDWQKNATGMEKAKVAAVGLTGVLIGTAGVKDAYRSIAKEGYNLGNTLEAIGGGFASMAGGAMAGFAIAGPWGAAIGAIGSGLFTVISALDELTYEKRDIWGEMLDANGEKIDEFTQSLKEQYEQVEKNANQDITKAVASEKLISELDKIVDKNGKVKEGYEARANFIINQLNTAYGTEIKMVDGVIQEYDKQISAIKKQIEVQKAKIYQQMAEEKYAIAIKNQAEAEEKLNHVLAIKKGIEEDVTLTEEERAKKLAKVNKQIDKATNAINQNQQAVSEYEGITKAMLEGNVEDIKKWEKQISKSMNNATDSEWDYYVSAARMSSEYYKENLKLTKKSYDELNEQEKEFVTRQLKQFTDMFEEGVKKTGEITPEMLAAWNEMAAGSEEAFMAALEQLPKDLRQKVVSKMYPQGQGMSVELQKGIKSRFPEIKITPELNQPSNAILQNFKNTLGKKLSGIGIDLTTVFGGVFKANGGLYSSGMWRPMKAYANGGFPSRGEIFVARETGSPELVGRIGNSTAVMNNDQILDQMTIAVARGMSAVDRDTKVNIIAEGDADGMLNFINFKQISKNRQYGL